MPRFFVSSENIKENTVYIYGDDAHHISRSLRMAQGERITVCDMHMNEYECELSHFGDGVVEASVISSKICDTEPDIRVHLYQALPKGDKLDTIVQKAVECGVSEITVFESERCISKIKKESSAKKTERLSKIAQEAAKQCGRGIIPKVNEPTTYEKAVIGALGADIPIFCYEGADTRSLKEILTAYKAQKPVTVSVIIGSEGGFSQKEASFARERGMILAGLGKRILRCETAPTFVLGCLMYEFDL